MLARRTRWICLAGALSVAAGCSWQWGTLEARFDGPGDAGSDGGGWDGARDAGPGADAGSDVPLGIDAFDVPDAPVEFDAADETIVVWDVGPTDASTDAGPDEPPCTDACIPCGPGTSYDPEAIACLPVAVPRPVWPVSNAVLSTSTPALAVDLQATRGNPLPTEVGIEISEDPTFASVERTMTTVGGAGRFTLRAGTGPSGIFYWRTFGIANGGRGATSPVWTFTVPITVREAHDTFTGYAPTDVGAGGGYDVHSDVLITGHVNTTPVAYAFRGNDLGLDGNFNQLTPPSTATAGFGVTGAVLGVQPHPGGPPASMLVGDSANSSVSVYPLAYVSSGVDVAATMTLTQPGTGLGASIAVLGDLDFAGTADVAVAAPSGNTVYVYRGESVTTSSQADWQVQCPSGCPLTQFGQLTAAAGDVDGDGRADLVVSSKGDTVVLVYPFDAGARAFRQPWRIDTPSGSGTVTAVAGAGDVDGDGFGDLLVALINGVQNDAVLLYPGGPGGPATSPSRTIGMPGILSVGPAGDMDGDGRADFVLGNAAYGARGVQLYESSNPAMNNIAILVDMNTYPASQWGTRIALAGDINGDGLSDLIAGDPGRRVVTTIYGAPGPNYYAAHDEATPTSSSDFGNAVAARPASGTHSRSVHPAG